MIRRAVAALPARLLTLGILAAVLVAILATEWRSTPAPSSLRPVAASGQPTTVSPGTGIAGLVKTQTSRNVATILARPLFSPNRHPDAAAASDVAGLPRLTGVMISSAGKVAIFASASGARPVVVGEGGSVGSYLIGSIDIAGVTVVGRDGRRVLHPSFDPNPPSKLGGVPAAGHAVGAPPGK